MTLARRFETLTAPASCRSCVNQTRRLWEVPSCRLNHQSYDWLVKLADLGDAAIDHCVAAREGPLKNINCSSDNHPSVLASLELEMDVQPSTSKVGLDLMHEVLVRQTSAPSRHNPAHGHIRPDPR